MGGGGRRDVAGWRAQAWEGLLRLPRVGWGRHSPRFPGRASTPLGLLAVLQRPTVARLRSHPPCPSQAPMGCLRAENPEVMGVLGERGPVGWRTHTQDQPLPCLPCQGAPGLLSTQMRRALPGGRWGRLPTQCTQALGLSPRALPGLLRGPLTTQLDFSSCRSLSPGPGAPPHRLFPVLAAGTGAFRALPARFPRPSSLWEA